MLREQIEARSEALDDTQTANMVIESIPAAEISAAQANGTRFLHAVKRIGRLQQHTINAQIDARQKRREIGFKRRDVWDCDANFMKELQSLVGQEKLEGFPSLSKLAEKCQIARDGLGPLEEEGSMAEMRLEGKFWKLQQAEKSVFTEFENTFGSEDSYATEPSSSSTSIYDPPFDEHGQSLREEDKDEVAIIPRSLPSSSNFEPTLPGPGLSASLDRDDIYQDSMLLGLNDNTAKLSEGENIYLEYSDSGIGDIDNPPDVRTTGSTAGHFHPLPGRPQASVEPYPHLVTDFGSRRDRINKWLEHMMLVSPLESSTLFGVLQNQLNPKMPIPSNWSQLVIAYWELDGATTPNIRPSPRPEILPVHSNHESQKHLHERLYATGNQTHSVKIAPANPHPESL